MNQHIRRLFVASAVFGLLAADAQGFLSGFIKPSIAADSPVVSDETGVSVTTDKFRYQVGETIVVRVTNPLNTAITTRDQRFQCSVITLERRNESGGEWTEIRNCFSGAPASEVTLEPGTSTTIRLESGGNMSGPLEPGMYRAALDYSRGERLSHAPGHLLVARSEQFQIEQKQIE